MQINLGPAVLGAAAMVSLGGAALTTDQGWRFADAESLRNLLTTSAPARPLQSAAPQVSTAAADTTVIRHDISVQAVDPEAQQAPNKHTGVPNLHLALVPSDAPSRAKRLFLFVNGTNQSETSSQEFINTGPRKGYHTISIAYPNYDAVAVTCAGSLDDDCTGKVREEILTGQDLSPLVAIRSADALEPRLLKLLQYLKTSFPNEGWGSFIRQGEVDWNLVSIAGHSQGAGHVALMAKRHSFTRVAIISGVADVTATGQPAAWLYRPNVTPDERIWGFTHVADYVVPIVLAQASWKAIGIDRFGPARSTDGQAAPYGGSHMLTTALLPASGTNPHLAMIDDNKLPRNPDGRPAYVPVWEHMLVP